ncbi:MAG: hypothetical protein QOF88_4529, partial [Mycobacterium sp.]|nr:hypothetical protein [Mycobacterium sp.]
MAATHSKESTMSTNITNRIAAATVAL